MEAAGYKVFLVKWTDWQTASKLMARWVMLVQMFYVISVLKVYITCCLTLEDLFGICQQLVIHVFFLVQGEDAGWQVEAVAGSGDRELKCGGRGGWFFSPWMCY